MRKFHLFGLLFFFLALLAGPVSAESEKEKELGLLLDYLAADLEITEGTGLQKLKLGDPMSKAASVFGQPAVGRELRSDALVFGITLDSNTRLRITGKNRVQRMSFKGNSLSQYKTRSGAGFGIPSYQVVSIYGAPVFANGRETLAYPKKGISFHMTRGVVSVIEIYVPIRE